MSRRRLHIAYVCGDRGVPIGGDKGASAHIGEMTRALTDRGAEIRILGARVRRDVEQEELPAPSLDLGSQRASRQARQVLSGAGSSRREQARASEAWGLMLNQTLTRSLERLNKEWPIDAIYERYSLWTYGGAGFARSMRIPHLLEVNAPLRQEQKRYRSLENEALAATLESYMFRSVDRVLVPSSQLRPYILGCGARPGAVHVIPNAADPDRFRPERRRQRLRDNGDAPFVIGFLGSLKPWHGIDILARAFRRLRRSSREYRLLIVGDGPMRRELERAFRRDGCADLVTFTGAADYDDVPELVSRMDAGLAPYPRGAGFYFSPIKIFEYMAAGVPIVASDIGQIGELMTHRKTALLHRPGAVTEIAGCIERLATSPTLADSLARNARAMLCRRFTWRRNAERVLAMIATIAKKNSASN